MQLGFIFWIHRQLRCNVEKVSRRTPSATIHDARRPPGPRFAEKYLLKLFCMVLIHSSPFSFVVFAEKVVSSSRSILFVVLFLPTLPRRQFFAASAFEIWDVWCERLLVRSRW